MRGRSVVDISGQVFGRLTVLEKACQDRLKRWKWLCRCSCGVLIVVSSNNLRSGNTKSCGCLHIEKKASFHARVIHRSGDQHYRWNPNRDAVVVSRPSAVRGWARRVIRGHRGRCLKCGSTIKPRAHHADGWSFSPERRFDLTNGACLCSYHHREFHRICGRERNTQEQLHAYLGWPPIEREVINTIVERPDGNLGFIFDLLMIGELQEALLHLKLEIKQLEGESENR